MDWNSIQRLLSDLLDVAPYERAAWLERRCGNDAGLRGELESLLQAAEGSSVLDTPILSLVGTAEINPAEMVLPEGARLGPWEVQRFLGRGGMGEVYLAKRIEGGFQQRAAVKLLRQNAAAHAARFEAERAILAQLDHPGIARLLDGGISGAHAWMAMDYVEGVHLAKYSSVRRLRLEDRLALFRQTCEAIAYAHANLVIHRDIKSSNVLVGADGRVKLLDFGVAKLLDVKGASQATVTGTAPFTPDHAAPEQLRGAPPTIAVDIFALGVLLYELLVGHGPWSQGESPLSRAIDKLMREDPRPPSYAAARTATAPVSPRRLRGDLDAIVTRCLRPEPADRYPTVQALLDDLARYERSEPVQARKGNGLYRTKRLVQRNRMVVAVASILSCALLVTSAVAILQAAAKTKEAERAQLALKQSESVRSLMESVFMQANPKYGQGRETTASELLTTARERTLAVLGDEPLVAAMLLVQIGAAYSAMGMRDLARDTSREAVALNQRAPHPSLIVAASAGGLLAYRQCQDGECAAALAALNRIITRLQTESMGGVNRPGIRGGSNS